MSLKQQKQRVDRLAAMATCRKAEVARTRRAFRGWTQNYFGSAEGLAWSFATGAWWAAGRRSRQDGSNDRSRLANAVNASWLAWQLVNRKASWLPSTDD